MLFAFSKIERVFIHPLHVLLLLLVVGLALHALGQRRPIFKKIGRIALWTAGAGAVVISLTPFGSWVAYGIENRVERGQFDLDHVAGAIILGGSTGDPKLVDAHGMYMLNDGAERLTTVVALRRQRPDIPIIVSGGSGLLFPGKTREPEITRMFLKDMGIDPSTVEIEGRSRDTYENAIYTAELLKGRPGPYLLVTSAFHMPRALGCFRKAGIEVIPYPVDYRIAPPRWLDVNPYHRLEDLDLAVPEIVGMISYRLVGWTDAFFPK
jgi:uncharacterized SAM-binding protein YcdF (DUF218 family)